MRPEAVRDLLTEHLADAVVTPLDGGRSSRARDVRTGGLHRVLRSVAPHGLADARRALEL